jgi:hypothetical protein
MAAGGHNGAWGAKGNRRASQGPQGISGATENCGRPWGLRRLWGATGDLEGLQVTMGCCRE